MLVVHNDGTIGAWQPTIGWGFSDNANITTNERRMASWILTGGNIYYFVDGVNYGSDAFAYTDTTSHNFFAGSRYSVNNAYDFNGQIDDIRIYNYAMTQEDLEHIYNTDIQKTSSTERTITTPESNLSQGAHSYQTCAENAALGTGCTETRNYYIPSFDISKTANTGTYEAGDYVTYTLTVTGASGIPTTDYVINDTLAEGLTYVSHSFEGTSSHTLTSGTNQDGTTDLTWSNFDLSPGYTGSIILTAQITEGFLQKSDIQPGRAYDFTPTSEYINIPDSTDFTLGSTYTISAWINPDNTANHKGIVGTYNGEGFIFLHDSTNTLRFWDGTASTWIYSSFTPPEDGTWKHVAFTCNGSAGTFYYNGSNQSSTCNAITDGGRLEIGGGGQ